MPKIVASYAILTATFIIKQALKQALTYNGDVYSTLSP